MRPDICTAGILGVLLLTGCGGSNEEAAVTPQTPPPASPPAPVTYALGGTVSGLKGSVTIEATGGNSLTVTSNGTFTFPTPLAAGTAYSVTISLQPADVECAVANARGALNTAVSNVGVSCSTPLDAYFVPVVSSVGLQVFENRRIERPLRRISSEDISAVSLIPRLSVSGAAVTAARPGSLLYRTRNASTGDRLWMVDLDAESSLVPRQVSTLTFSMDSALVNALRLCSAKAILRRLDDPSTAFFILNVASGGPPIADEPDPCWGPTRRTVVIKATDDAASAPVPVADLSDTLEPIYNPDGTLSGIVALDANLTALVIYPDESFTNPTPLITGVGGAFSAIRGDPAASSPWTGLAGPLDDLVISVLQGNAQSLYRIDQGRRVTRLPGSSAIRSGSELLILEYPDLNDSATYRALSVWLDGSRPQRVLWTATRDPDCGLDSIFPLKQDVVWVFRRCTDRAAGMVATTVLSATSSSPPGLSTLMTLEGAAFFSRVGSNVLLEFVRPVGQFPPRLIHSALMLDSNGVVRIPRTEGLKVAALDSSHFIAVRNIPAAGTVGGELVGAVIADTGAPTFLPFKMSDGSALHISPDAGFDSATGTGNGRAIAWFEDSTGVRSNLLLDFERMIAVKMPADRPAFTLISSGSVSGD